MSIGRAGQARSEREPTSKKAEHGRLAIRRVICLSSVLVCVLMAGCRDVKTVWSTESSSPDGQWVAAAHTDQYGGPGTAGIISTVSLRPVKGRRDTINILTLSQDAVEIDLKLRWLSPAHLEITYKQPASVDFQAIKCAGIEITVRDTSLERNGVRAYY